MNTCHYTLVQTHGMLTPRVNCNVSSGLQVIMMCQHRFIICNNILLWLGVLKVEEAVHVWGKGLYDKSLYLPLSFAVNLKNCSKNKVC